MKIGTESLDREEPLRHLVQENTFKIYIKSKEKRRSPSYHFLLHMSLKYRLVNFSSNVLQFLISIFVPTYFSVIFLCISIIL